MNWLMLLWEYLTLVSVQCCWCGNDLRRARMGSLAANHSVCWPCWNEYREECHARGQTADG